MLSLFCYALLCVHFSFAIILKNRNSRLLCYCCLADIITINVLWLFLTVRWVGLQYVIVVFTDHTHMLCICCVLSPSREVVKLEFILKLKIKRND